MGYVDTVLQPGETVRFRTGRHWVVYLPGVAIAVAAVAGLAAALTVYLEADFPTTWDAVWVGVALAVLAFGMVLLARNWFRRRFTEIAVTDRRVIYKSGGWRRSTSEMPVERIETIEVEQGLLGQMLDFGKVSINGIGSGIGPDKLWCIASPLRLRSEVTAGSGARRLPAGPVIADVGSPSVFVAPVQPSAPPVALPENAAAAPAR
ncbi:MAG: PH domain-containing protein [Rhodoplanes sp.]|uniref:PH domain-containing protein n=1 Tax=Rhodoplanes sp. TaxID=1968906 RepID=UPI00182DCC3A|nr:PH domain-containing protein [Rhodoplanes sp.]NVO12777.1 PH domain-containing protein [Rhodoplanes sp.]